METIVIVGGGYAGANAAKAVKAKLGERARVVLVEKEAYHLKKVRLVQAAAFDTDLRKPYDAMFAPGEVDIVQGELLSVETEERFVRIADGSCGARDGGRRLAYDRLVLALGSVVRPAPEGAGGIALADEASARRIRERVEAGLQAAAQEPDPARRAALASVVIAGGGVSGVETAAELARAMAVRAAELGLAPSEAAQAPRVTLVCAGERLAPAMGDGPAAKLEARLRELGVAVLPGARVVRETVEGAALEGGRTLPCGLVVWTIGVETNSLVPRLGLPVGDDGRLLTDGYYRVKGYDTIGDNARIVDVRTGIEDGRTCREAMLQAQRLAAVLAADAAGRPAAPHRAPSRAQGVVALGSGEGIAWMRKWGIDWTITGVLGGKIREVTWNGGSPSKA
ncbi:FAD-dependent oxidoreductase [Paenibacillus sp. TRM 82003]|nr:FAD-dependent oxidoreductase [Paenibacillus sp. TRM 82003]